ncbi:MAG: hypothetical protein DRG20_00990 [Deltaproteobacteria bacterium]|nr:glycosyltransferase family 2 protein [Deltaproteobacteria bacterium]RLA91547.1 MAG: hypothetical protein DRG20_00990 [Deltaproteobacteria bacterium]
MIDLSVVIVHYCRPLLLKECLESLFRQKTKYNIEVIVVDNGSNISGIKEILDKFPGIIPIFLKKNLGYGAACNRGFAKTKGEFTLFMNEDTVIQSKALDEMIEFARAKPLLGIEGPKILNQSGELQLSYGPFPTIISAIFDIFKPKNKRKYYIKDYDKAHLCNWVTGAAFMIRRKTAEQVGLFDENYFLYYEDIDLCFRTIKKGWEIWYNPKPAVIHKHPHNSRNEKDLYLEGIIRESHLFFHKKHYGYLNFLILKTLTLLYFLLLSLVPSYHEEGLKLFKKVLMIR